MKCHVLGGGQRKIHSMCWSTPQVAVTLNAQSWINPNPRSQELLQSPTWVQGPKLLDCLLLLSQAIRSEVGQPGLKSAGNGFICTTQNLSHLIFIFNAVGTIDKSNKF